MRVLIVYNSKKSNGLEIAESALKLLTDIGVNTSIIEFSDKKVDDVYFIKQFQRIVTVGGDGTIIKVAKTAAVCCVPIIGINAGRLGYLASVDSDRLSEITKIITDDCVLEKRMMLTAKVYSNGELVETCDCLNDIVIGKSSVANMLDIEVSVDNDKIKYRADGLIMATPTGSTAYSMSAGGPVVDPSVDCFVLTAVCPHTLMNRSVIVGTNTDVSVRVLNSDIHNIVLSSDGRAVCEIDENCVVKIEKSDITVSFIKLNDVSVYKIFSEKTKVE